MPVILPLLLAAVPVQAAVPVSDDRVVCEPKRDRFGRKTKEQTCLTVAQWADYVRFYASDVRTGPTRAVPFASTNMSNYYTSPSFGRP